MKAITIWIDEKEHKAAQKKAEYEERSLSWLVRKLLREYPRNALQSPQDQ